MDSNRWGRGVEDVDMVENGLQREIQASHHQSQGGTRTDFPSTYADVVARQLGQLGIQTLVFETFVRDHLGLEQRP